MNRVSILVLFFISFQNIFSQVELSYYLPEGQTYDQSVVKPSEVLGFEVGEWHASHDKIVSYAYELSESSSRVKLFKTGETYENRPTLLMAISHPDNIARLDDIKQKHALITDGDPSNDPDLSDVPVVVWMGYSVHGNEASGANAGLLAAYHFAAGQGNVLEDLKDVVVLIDPAINPDGIQRFSTWVNSNRNLTETVDPDHREFDESYPRGRTNHYWFDLNRDWLPVQLPSSKARIAYFQEWMPNVLTDHHEMGSNSTFFFQPGIPQRTHPLTPGMNQSLTERIGEFHAEALDKIGSLYYTKESFDDFYYGKGSTYPDIQGSIGILFEQASSRGHAQETVNGILRFPFGIRNQFITSLSTFRAAKELKEELLKYQSEFYENSLEDASDDARTGLIFGAEHDPIRARNLAEVFKRHNIKIFETEKDYSAAGKNFKKGEAYIVPFDQPKYRLIKAMTETRTEFTDSLFYDISAWSYLLSFNLDYNYFERNIDKDLIGSEFTLEEESRSDISSSDYAYIIDWRDYYAPAMVYQLLNKGIRVKYNAKKFTLPDGTVMPEGTLMVPVENQQLNSDQIFILVNQYQKYYKVKVYGINTGYTQGINLGSPNMDNLNKPNVLLVAGEGVNSYDAGEIWHLFDVRMDMPVTIVAPERLDNINLNKYSVIVMPDGSYRTVDGGGKSLKQWVQSGGTIVAMRDAGGYLKKLGLNNAEYKKEEEDTTQVQIPYALRHRYRGAQYIGGNIFKAKLDLTHPLAYGYSDSELPMFRRNTTVMEVSKKNPYVNPITYTSDPLISGYISKENLDRLSETAAVHISGYGSGKVIVFSDNLNFRAFWYGTNKMFLNAVFFGKNIGK
ncbi:M14 family metallopeptidase [Mangrovivirga sp. M17]|uniref:M14 family metallopeptidase n=1 Tax=Mangrovivirga halotolerans TaxID=2993936 RepID=A0ABT3RSD5_9BACT|nr:M14 family metallopeptidase [Mangrovivirga halotolerans]MCX2744483.1 M14 family metallopeptidase [Mangrovivirga halotolerans]